MNFDSFVRVVGHFLEEQDEEAMQKELKEAFRLYDKEGKDGERRERGEREAKVVGM